MSIVITPEGKRVRMSVDSDYNHRIIDDFLGKARFWEKEKRVKESGERLLCATN